MKTFFVVVSLTLFLTACGQSDEPAAVAAPEVTRLRCQRRRCKVSAAPPVKLLQSRLCLE